MEFDRDFLAYLSSRLTVAGLADRLGVSQRGSRYFCPVCQPGGPAEHKTPDLSITDQGFHCFKCGVSGGDAIAFVRVLEGLSFPEAVRRAANYAGIPLEGGQERTGDGRNKPRTSPSRGFSNRHEVIQGGGVANPVTPIFGGPVRIQEKPIPRPDLLSVLEELAQALPGSPGEEYLQNRGFSLALAQGYGVGYATPAMCRTIGLDRGQPPVLGRVVFPHYCPTDERSDRGQVITQLCSLYGRAVELGQTTVGKESRHRHLPGAKGWFNCSAVDAVGHPEPLILCEGAFDALAWIAAGHRRTLATYGAHVGRLDWLRETRSILVAFDFDGTGQASTQELARELHHRGKTVYVLEPDAFQGAKDAAEAWASGTLRLDILKE